MPNIKDQKSLERVAGEMAFSRGKTLYLKEAVKSIAKSEKYLEGLVQDSQADPFQVRISFKGLHQFKSAQCSCPFNLGAMCKHSVAVLQHWLNYLSITPHVDLSKSIVLDKRQLKINSQTPALPIELLPKEEKIIPKKSLKPSYVLPEYQFRSSHKPLIQISLSTSGFIDGLKKSVPFKLYVVVGEEKFVVANIQSLINTTRSRYSNLPQFSSFSPMQQYVLNFLNELLKVEKKESKYTQQQFWIKRMQWAVYLGVIGNCAGVEFVDSKTDEPVAIKFYEKISLTIRIRPVNEGQWAVNVSFKDPNDLTRDFKSIHIQEGHPIWLFDESNSSFQPMHESIAYPFLIDFLEKERILDEPQIPYFITSVLNPLRASCEIIEDDTCLKKINFHNSPLRCRLNLDYVNETVKGTLFFDYQNQQSYPYDGLLSVERFSKVLSQEDLTFIIRDIEGENKKAQLLISQYGFEWKKNSKIFVKLGTNDILSFVSNDLPGLKTLMDVHCSEDFEDKLLNNIFFQPLVRVSGSGIDWFEFDAVYKAAGIDEEITHSRIKKLLVEGQTHIQLKKGNILPIPKELFDQIEAITSDFDQKKLHVSQMPFVMQEINRQGLDAQVDAQAKATYEKLQSFQSIEPVTIPESLKDILRDYQRKGVDWLSFLKQFRFGGVLADEMGLGKTIQALTILQREIEAGSKLPSLVVCPTTLVWNWQEEINKFLPNVSVLVLNGKDRRELFDQISKVQVVITSYPLLRRDIELYNKKTFNYVILDEAQNIKNKNTQNSQVAKSLKSSMRLAMTGTPLENSIMDLWSIFDFLMPGFLGSAEKFRRNYEIPISKLQDQEQLSKLSRRIMPFVLRRLKKDVIKDLPEKIEQVSLCELEPTQAKIYGEMIEKAREVVSKSVNEQGFEKSRMIILTLILRLRQICCHPLIAGVNLGHRSVSGKMELLKETIDELLAGGHKVLVFSQFVQMLKIMEEHLNREKITYAYMDGSSKNRQEEVERFNNDPSLRVFLLSLKVGGVGLNLTSADTVIIYEPWWNPAVENQAIDRVHRIGQNNSVLAYRLITKGTIEEKILQLQSRKRFLMDALVLSEESIGKKLDWEDVKFLLDMK